MMRYLKSLRFFLLLIFTAAGALISCTTVPPTVALEKQGGLTGHVDQVLSLDISPDGRLLASGSSDDTVRIWTVIGNADPIVLEGHGGDVYSVKFSPDGKLLATACEDSLVRIYDVESGRRLNELESHSTDVYYLAWSPDGKYLASVGKAFTARFWSTYDFSLLSVYRGHKDRVNMVTFSNDGNFLITGSRDGTVKIWTVPEGEVYKTLDTEQMVFSIALSPDGNTLAVSAAERDESFDSFHMYKSDIHLYQRQGDEIRKLKTFKAGEGIFWSLEFSPDGQFLFGSGSDDSIVTWDLKDYRRGQYIKSPNGNVWEIDIAPNFAYLAAATTNNVIEIYTTQE